MAEPERQRRAGAGRFAAVVAAAVMAVPLAPAAPAAATSSGGSPYVWGVGLTGQLGTTLGAAVPVPLAGVEGITFTDIDIGVGFDLALTIDGTVYGWGQNSFGQLGRGTTSNVERTPMPVEMPDGVRFATVAAGYQHGLALAPDGTAHTWGNNSFGQLGDDTLSDRHAPGPVVMPAGASFVDLAGGPDASAAVADDGTVYSWGGNHLGQLGDGTTEGREPIPAAVAMPDGVRFTATAAGDRFAMALAYDGTVYTWGNNSFGQLGNGTTGGFNPTPAPVVMPDGVRFTAISAGRHFAMALADDGTVHTWGNNTTGQLGNGTTGGTDPTPGPIVMPADTTFAAVDGGTWVGSALTPDGALYVWGRNVNRLFGDGTVTFIISNTPVQTVPPDGGTFGAAAMTSGSMSNGGITGLPPHAVTAHDGDGQVAYVNEPFVDPLQAAVTTQAGGPVPGVPVTFTIHSPATFADGESSAVAFTADGGLATTPPLVATSETGPVEVTATIPGVAEPATFTLTVLPEPEPPPAVDPQLPPAPGAPDQPRAPDQPPAAAPGAAGAADTAEPAGTGALPDTGNHAGPLLVLGAGLTAAGLLLLALTRRRAAG